MSCSRRGLVQRDAPPIVVVAKSAQLRFPRRHKLRIPRSGHANQNSLTSLLRLSPPRRRGGDPNAKTAPAPLHPKGTSAPTPWAWALLLSPPRGARRGPLSVLAEKKTGRTRKGYAASVSGKAANGCAIARSKRKGRLGALRCSGPPRDGGRRIGACSDLGLPSGTLGSSAKSMLPSRGGWCRPRRGGHRIDQLLFSLPLAAPRGNWYNGRMRASAPTGKW